MSQGWNSSVFGQQSLNLAGLQFSSSGEWTEFHFNNKCVLGPQRGIRYGVFHGELDGDEKIESERKDGPIKSLTAQDLS